MTAPVFASVAGTGKGLTYSNIIVPLLYMENTKAIVPNQIDNFNDWVGKKTMLLYEEADFGGINAQFLGTMKAYITESYTDKRAMYRNSESNVRNYLNVMLFSNAYTPLTIEMGDRRYVIAPRQEITLFKAHPELDPLNNDPGFDLAVCIKAELPELCSIIFNTKVDNTLARQHSNISKRSMDEKETLIQRSKTSVEGALISLFQGNVQFILSHLQLYDYDGIGRGNLTDDEYSAWIKVSELLNRTYNDLTADPPIQTTITSLETMAIACLLADQSYKVSKLQRFIKHLERILPHENLFNQSKLQTNIDWKFTNAWTVEDILPLIPMHADYTRAKNKAKNVTALSTRFSNVNPH